MKRFLSRLFDFSECMNKDNILRLLEVNPLAKLLDLGCGSGEFTLACAQKIGTKEVYAVEIDTDCINKAKDRGIQCIQADLNSRLLIDSDSFDIILSNQVIEHLISLDIFIGEIYRVLKPGGYAVISTENLASWHNIFALVLGYRPFSQHYTDRMFGNPLSPRDKAEELAHRVHTRIFAYRPFKELFELSGFKVARLLGAGYYPLPFGFLSKFMSKVDPRHTHFITAKVRK